MAEPVPQKPLSVEEYLKLEEAATTRHEYVGGKIYTHAGASDRHNRLAGNIFARLWNAARDGPCRIYMSDMKLRVPDDVFYYPNVMVVCDPPDTENPLFRSDACLVVEITSPGTETIDRREKLLAYRKLPSLKAYLIVDQESLRVERHWRDEAGQWWQAEAVGHESLVPIPCPEIELTLPQIYEGLDA